MRVITGVIFLTLLGCLCAFTSAVAKGCAANEPFVQADRLFSESAKATDDAAAQKLWEDGTAVLRAHRDEPMPGSCNPDDYALTRLVAFEHGLRVGYKWTGMSIAESLKVAKNFEDTALVLARGKRSVSEVYQSWWSAGFKERLQIARGYQTELMAARHHPSGPNCSDPNVEVEASNPVTPEYPESAKETNAGQVTVTVLVEVSETGGVTGAKIAQSSGNYFLDNASLQAARVSTFLPKVQNCTVVPGSYLFRATFDPNA